MNHLSVPGKLHTVISSEHLVFQWGGETSWDLLKFHVSLFQNAGGILSKHWRAEIFSTSFHFLSWTRLKLFWGTVPPSEKEISEHQHHYFYRNSKTHFEFCNWHKSAWQQCHKINSKQKLNIKHAPAGLPLWESLTCLWEILFTVGCTSLVSLLWVWCKRQITMECVSTTWAVTLKEDRRRWGWR